MSDQKPLSVLVTAGGTQEDIDTVRSIANHSTGRLGCLIADTFIRHGATVTCLCGETSLRPASPSCEVITIRSVSQLVGVLDTLLSERQYDCVIHSMAVSDFTPRAITTVDEMAEAIAMELSKSDVSSEDSVPFIRNVIVNRTQQPSQKKISSQASDLVIVLKQTPKVIGRFKARQPKTLLVGFKLLSGASASELRQAALALMAQNGCDYVLANDLNDISGETHKAVLFDQNGFISSADTKQEIAQMIFKTVTERLNGST